jgi:radical SAM protein with 4Fe4S-binding SPASM domain
MLRIFIKKLSLGKIENLILLKLSYWVSIVTRKAHIWAYPTSISIEPVDYCNLQCVECPSGNGNLAREKKMMSIDSFQKIINQLSPNVIYLSLYFQGEPLLHPDFSEMIKIASDKRIFTSTSTNGHFLDNDEKVKKLIQSGLDRLIISVDGTTQETYEKYRKGGSLQKVIAGIENVMRLKKELKSNTPFVEVQFLVMSHNENQIDTIKELCRNWGVDKLRLKTAQVYDFENGNPLIPSNKKYSRYEKKSDGKYYLKGKLKNNCWRQWSAAVITSTDDVIPCCFDKNANFVFGNLLDSPFKEIWKSKKANSFRQAILKNRKAIDICRNCTEV